MIVRINQFDAHQAEALGGWPTRGLSGPIEYEWPGDTQAFELLILDKDEGGRPLGESYRQTQMRQMLPEVLAALRVGGHELVARLDGPIAADELAPAFAQLTDARGYGRFSVSSVEKLTLDPGTAVGSVRLQAIAPRFAALCADPALGLERSVRLRVFSLPDYLVNPLLDITYPEDERWDEVLEESAFCLSTVRGLQGIHVLTRWWGADQVRSLIMGRLTTAAMSAASSAASPQATPGSGR